MGYQGSIIWDKSKPDGTPRKKLNYEKFKNLGWEASIDLKVGLSETIKDFECKFSAGLLKS